MPPAPPAVIAATPAFVSASVVLVTTSTLYGSAAAALSFADAAAGSASARLASAKPTPSFLLTIKNVLLSMTSTRAHGPRWYCMRHGRGVVQDSGASAAPA